MVVVTKKKPKEINYLTFVDEDGNVVMRLKSDDLVVIVAEMIAEIFNKSEKVDTCRES